MPDSEPRLGDGQTYEDAMEIREEKRQGLSRRCPACLLGWADCMCRRWCNECRCFTNHEAPHPGSGEDEGFTPL